MAGGKPRVLCAWCGRVIEEGEGRVSHGMCEACVPKVLAEIDELARLRAEHLVPPRAPAEPESEGQSA